MLAGRFPWNSNPSFTRQRDNVAACFVWCDASNSPTTVSVVGNGVSSQGILTLSPTSINFGDVTLGSSDTRNVTATSSGTTVVLVSGVNVNGADFSVAGLNLPLNLSPGETATFSITLTPSTAGNVTGSVSLLSDGSNSPTTVSLTGNGVQVPSASIVDLFWDASISVVDGYYVYRSTQSGGPYTKLNATLVSTTSFSDNTVAPGTTYFYVATAVDANGVESVVSNETQAVVP